MMTTTTLPIDPINYGNFCFPGDDENETINTSKAKGELEVFQSCSRYIQQVSGVLPGFTFFAKSTGQCLVDPVTEIRNSRNFETLLVIAREWISAEIANSLAELYEYPLEENELPLDLTLAKNFLLYSFSKGLNKPVLSATHEGLLQADWDNEEGTATVAIRFLASDKVWVTTRTEEMRGTVEIALSALLADVPPLNLPAWANE